MTASAPLRSAAFALLCGVAAATVAEAQDSDAADGDPWADPRPPVVAYVVSGGDRIEQPLGGRVGDAERGRAIFADPEAGGCISCHAVPGSPRQAVAPRVLRERAGAPSPEEAPGSDSQPAESEEEVVAEAETAAAESAPSTPSDSDSAQAPREGPFPATRPRGAEPSVRSADAAMAEPTVSEPAEEAEVETEAPPRPLPAPPAGPDLAGVGDRHPLGVLRLWIVDPRAFGVAPADKPGYHAVDPDLASVRPGFRQPWFSPQQVEDVAAYLATLSEE